MNRLVAVLDELASDGRKVVIQSAAYGLEARYADMLGVIPQRQLLDLIGSADVVITHGGPGTISLVLQAQRTPIIVPRDPRNEEHVDDHQMRFARWLEGRYDVVVVTDPLYLPRLIEDGFTSRRNPGGRVVQSADGRKAVSRLREILGT